jgi:hypothetical protein
MPSTILRAAGFALLVLLPACGGGGVAGEAAAKDVASPAQPMAEAVDTGAESDASGREDDQRLADNRPPPAPPPPGAAAPPPPPPAPDAGKRADAGGEVARVRAPMLIYTAQITMAVFEVNASLVKVEAIGRELGGFLAKRDDSSITIRVPAARFDEAVQRIEGVGDMLHRNVAAEDVTEQFRDLEIRLKSARAVQQRLTELLAKAAKVEDSLAIERELDRVSGEIERLEGRIKFLRDRAAFSTLTVTFQAKATEQVGKSQVKLPVNWIYNLGLKRLLDL